MNRLAIIDVVSAEMRAFASAGDSQQRIHQYFYDMHLTPSRDAIPWSATLVNWVLKQTGYKGTDSSMARSFQHWGMTPEYPCIGCVVLLAISHHPWQGYVGLYLGKDADGNVICLGANSKDKISTTAHPADSVLAYRIAKTY